MLLSPETVPTGTILRQLIFIGYPSDNALPIFGAHGFIEDYERAFFNSANYREELIEWSQRHHLSGSALVINARAVHAEDKNNILQFLKSHYRLKSVPVIVVSDRIHLTESSRYIQAGADDYYDAPVFWDELLNRLQFLIKYKAAIVEVTDQLDTSFLTEQAVSVTPLKRLMDIIVGITGLIVLSPVMLLTALAIRLESKGPVIYRSTRIGAGYKSFSFWKFRSMYEDADERLEQMIRQNQYGESATFVKFVNDPRVTKVGRVIRKYSIDELPQVYNILKGDMSVVGNRPLPVYEAAQLVNQEAVGRFLAPAGLTGLWQVNKRGNEQMDQQERIALDLKYAECNTLWTDIKIIARTFFAFVQKENV